MFYSEDEGPRLTSLPPELSEHLLQFLPSLSLRLLPLLNTQLGRQARKEVEARHARLDKKQMEIMTESGEPASILNTISMVCPGLVILYNASKTGQSCEAGGHTLRLNMTQPLFSTTNTR